MRDLNQKDFIKYFEQAEDGAQVTLLTSLGVREKVDQLANELNCSRMGVVEYLVDRATQKQLELAETTEKIAKIVQRPGEPNCAVIGYLPGKRLGELSCLAALEGRSRANYAARLLEQAIADHFEIAPEDLRSLPEEKE